MGSRRIRLPPKALRLCGPMFSDDAYFLASARREADRLVHSFGLRASSRLLDVGCGVGRLAIGIIDRLGPIQAYRGTDVDPRYVRWCQKHIQHAHPTFQFVTIDVGNPRYNPGGPAVAGDFRHPFDDGSFEIVYLYSVFSHMETEQVRIYLRDFRRLLASNGRLFFTSFAEEGVPDLSINPKGYRREWSGPLHCVRYRRGFLESLLQSSGFSVDQFDYATETDGQSAFACSLKDLPADQ